MPGIYNVSAEGGKFCGLSGVYNVIYSSQPLYCLVLDWILGFVFQELEGGLGDDF